MAQLLVLENDLVKFQQIKTCLADHGHKAWHAVTANDGLEFMEQYLIDAVLCSAAIDRNELNGFVAELSKNEKWKHIPIVCYSLSGETPERVVGVTKQFELPEFDSKLFSEQVQQCMPANARKNDSLGGEVKTYSLHEVNWSDR